MSAPVIHMQSDLHRVGLGLSVRFTLDGEHFGAVWHPRPPSSKREYQAIVVRYRAARDKFLTEVGKRIGGAVVVVDL